MSSPAPQYPQNILVLGAGDLGLPILTSLATHPLRSVNPSNPTKITLLLRPSTLTSPSPSQRTRNAHLASLGISFLPGDLATASEDELAELFGGFDAVVVATGYAAGGGTQRRITRAVVRAAGARAEKIEEGKKGKLRYIPFQFGVDYDKVGKGSAQELWDELLGVREVLRGETETDSKNGEEGGKGESGLEWTIVSTGLFMSFLFESFFGVVDLDRYGGDDEEGTKKKEITVRALGSWTNKVTVTTPEDIGRITAEVLFPSSPAIANEVRNRIVYIAGDTVTYQEIADIVEEALPPDVKVKREEWDMETLEKALKKEPDDGVKKYRVAFGKGVGVAWEKEGSFNVRYGIGVKGLREFAGEKLRR